MSRTRSKVGGSTPKEIIIIDSEDKDKDDLARTTEDIQNLNIEDDDMQESPVNLREETIKSAEERKLSD